MSEIASEDESTAAELLKPLEMLMTEFFSITSKNDRKRDIEEILKNFEKQDNSLKYCMYFMEKSNNHYVCMFALTTIENIINRKWRALTFSDKCEIKHWLWRRFTHGFPKSLSFLRNKLAKIIIDVVRIEWTTAYPDFFSQVLELVETEGVTPILGLVIIQAFTENLNSALGNESRISHLSQERRKEHQHLLTHYIPQLLNVLIGILDKFAVVQSSDNYFPNPPPSPEKGVGHSSGLSSLPVAGLPDLLTSSCGASRSEDQECREECIKLCLTAFQNLFSFLPQASHLPPSIFTSIYHWASVVTQTEFGEEVCIIAMSALNEMLYQRHTSLGNATIQRLSHETRKLLHHLTTLSNASLFNTLSQMYIDKIAEFLQLFISLHFKILDSDPAFDFMGHLLLIFQFTFQVPSCMSFVCCLDIWLKFISLIKPQDTRRYSEALLALIGGIMNKVQYQNNSSQLQQLDNELCNDNGETEWQVFLRNCVECIAKVAELAPLHIFKIIYDVWIQLADEHDNGTATQHKLLDLASLTQVLGRLAPTLFQEKDELSTDLCAVQASIFLERLMKILQYASVSCINNQNQSKTHKDALVLVHAGVLACMGSWCHYIPRHTVTLSTVSSLLQAAVLLLLHRDDIQHPPVLCHAAAHMLLSVTLTMRPTDPLQYIPDLYTQAQRSLSHLQPETSNVVRQALCIMILECPMDASTNPSGSIEGKRLQACASLIAAWCSPLLVSTPSSSPNQRLACLPALTHLLNYFADHPTQTKKLLAAGIERPIQATLELFKSYNHEVKGSEDITPVVLELFIALIHSLHQQLGKVFIRDSIHMFLDIARRRDHGALQQLLRVLQVGVEGGALGNATSLEEVINMCLEHILPLTQNSETDTDVTYALFDLFGSILLNRWQHFYSSCVRQGWSPAAPEGASDGLKTDHLTHFRAIMHAITESFLTDNIEVVRLNLRTMDCLNSQCKLYSKLTFREELLGHMLGVLLGLLIKHTAVGTLLQEEVSVTCYNLAAVDFTAYFDSFLPSFLTTIPYLGAIEIQELLSIPKDTDLPTFTQNLLRLTNDICYQLAKESNK